MRSLKKAISRFGGNDIKVIDGLDASPEAQRYLATLPYWVGRSPIINLPPSLLVMQGAFRFNERHPFVRAILNGRSELENFYNGFQPNDVAQMYRLPEESQGGDLPPWELPWLLRKRRPPHGKKGLALEHGVSFYGPCTDTKIDLEMKRLTGVVNSIKTRGYGRFKTFHISGHFLQSGDEVRFFVRGGKHRSAALTALGFTHVPVRMRDTWPRMVSREHVDHWPLVQSGDMSASFALAMFDRFFE